jgi:ankyrin repeat protein
MVELIVMTEIMHLFLDDPSEGNKRTALHYAAAEGKLMALKRLLKCGARVHAMDEEGNTPLHLAAAANQVLVCYLSLSLSLFILSVYMWSILS